MDVTSVAAYAMQKSMMDVQQATEISVMKKVMDQQEMQMTALLDQMASAQPRVHSGHLLDAYA